MSLAIAVATFGVVLLGGSKRAAADILLTVTAGGTTESFDFASNTGASTPISIDGYSGTIQTVVTTFPGTPGGGGTISTTVNITGSVTASDTLTTTVQLITPGSVPVGGPFASPPLSFNTQPLLPWTGGPMTTPVNVSAGTSFATSASVSTSGPLVTTMTFYNSPPASTFAASTGVVSATQNPLNNTGNNFNQLLEPNAGIYTLGQTVELTGINIGATAFNYGGTSSVTAVVPEPSTFLLAGLGGLGVIGYGLWRRKAMNK